MRMWEIRENSEYKDPYKQSSRESSRDMKDAEESAYSEGYECGFEDGYTKAMKDTFYSHEHRGSYAGRISK